jgi:hypothetical protein
MLGKRQQVTIVLTQIDCDRQNTKYFEMYPSKFQEQGLTIGGQQRQMLDATSTSYIPNPIQELV